MSGTVQKILAYLTLLKMFSWGRKRRKKFDAIEQLVIEGYNFYLKSDVIFSRVKGTAAEQEVRNLQHAWKNTLRAFD